MPKRLREKRKNEERGASILEAAFVAPVFFLLIFGIIEFGFLFRNYQTIGASATDAARTASIRGNDPEADFQTLQSFRQTFATWDLQDFEYIVIFEAAGPGSQVPLACKTGSSVVEKCNRYTVADLFKPVTDGSSTFFGDCTHLDALDDAWCPTGRDSSLGGTGVNAGVDLVGIYVEAEHKYITGFFKGSSTLSYTQVVRLEPSKE